MSVRAVLGARSARADDAARAAFLFLGLALVLARLVIVDVPERVALTTLAFAAILVGSLVVPVPRSHTRPRLGRGTTLGIGLVGLALATWAGGRGAPLPFGPLVAAIAVLAAVAEEALFRRVAFGWLAARSEVLAVVVTATAFALVHVPIYGWPALPVDLGAGLLLSWQRWACGDWRVPAATHAAANVVAVILR